MPYRQEHWKRKWIGQENRASKWQSCTLNEGCRALVVNYYEKSYFGSWQSLIQSEKCWPEAKWLPYLLTLNPSLNLNILIAIRGKSKASQDSWTRPQGLGKGWPSPRATESSGSGGPLPSKNMSKAREKGLITWGTPAKSNHRRRKEARGDPEGVIKRLSCDLSLWFWSAISTSRAILPLAISPLKASSWVQAVILNSYFWFLDHSENVTLIPEYHATQNSPYHCWELTAPLKFICGPLRGLWITIRFWSMKPTCAAFVKGVDRVRISYVRLILTVQMTIPA